MESPINKEISSPNATQLLNETLTILYRVTSSSVKITHEESPLGFHPAITLKLPSWIEQAIPTQGLRSLAKLEPCAKYELDGSARTKKDATVLLAREIFRRPRLVFGSIISLRVCNYCYRNVSALDVADIDRDELLSTLKRSLSRKPIACALQWPLKFVMSCFSTIVEAIRSHKPKEALTNLLVKMWSMRGRLDDSIPFSDTNPQLLSFSPSDLSFDHTRSVKVIQKMEFSENSLIFRFPAIGFSTFQSRRIMIPIFSTSNHGVRRLLVNLTVIEESNNGTLRPTVQRQSDVLFDDGGSKDVQNGHEATVAAKLITVMVEMVPRPQGLTVSRKVVGDQLCIYGFWLAVTIITMKSNLDASTSYLKFVDSLNVPTFELRKVVEPMKPTTSVKNVFSCPSLEKLYDSNRMIQPDVKMKMGRPTALQQCERSNSLSIVTSRGLLNGVFQRAKKKLEITVHEESSRFIAICGFSSSIFLTNNCLRTTFVAVDATPKLKQEVIQFDDLRSLIHELTRQEQRQMLVSGEPLQSKKRATESACAKVVLLYWIFAKLRNNVGSLDSAGGLSDIEKVARDELYRQYGGASKAMEMLESKIVKSWKVKTLLNPSHTLQIRIEKFCRTVSDEMLRVLVDCHGSEIILMLETLMQSYYEWSPVVEAIRPIQPTDMQKSIMERILAENGTASFVCSPNDEGREVSNY